MIVLSNRAVPHNNVILGSGMVSRMKPGTRNAGILKQGLGRAQSKAKKSVADITKGLKYISLR